MGEYSGGIARLAMYSPSYSTNMGECIAGSWFGPLHNPFCVILWNLSAIFSKYSKLFKDSVRRFVSVVIVLAAAGCARLCRSNWHRWGLGRARRVKIMATHTYIGSFGSVLCLEAARP